MSTPSTTLGAGSASAGRAHRVIASEAGAICWQLRNKDNRSLDKLGMTAFMKYELRTKN
jgi:hypothetical protein